MPPIPATLGLGHAGPWPEVRPAADIARLGKALAEAAQHHDLIVCDLWFGDHLGHLGQDPTPPDVLRAGRAYLERVDALLLGLMEAGAKVALTSDHGNLENLRVKAHTAARVPFAGQAMGLTDATDVVQGGRALRSALCLPLEADSDAKRED